MLGPEVYADISFLVNFFMDFLILWASASLAGIKIIYKRIAFASFFGGIYAVGSLFPGLGIYYSLPLKILFSFLMILLAMRLDNWNQFKKVLIYFYGINFLVAGASIATSYVFNSNPYENSFTFVYLLAGISCALAIGLFGKKYLLNKFIPNLLNFDIELRFDNNSCKGNAFLDTGNSLRDPLTNRPVIVAEYQYLKNILPEDFKSAVENVQDEKDMIDALIDTDWAKRLRIIPFSSIGRKNGMMLGVRADQVIINNGTHDIFYPNTVVGIYREKLSSEDKYHFLIPSQMLQEG
ncbi:MAG: sigma-E processing peptidase SpoIIGA [Syntrophomonadaceae bacterium]|nr:sigma-E processing peptidase SpoIIGA [Syntrophomonadaceae bacterium]